MTLDIPPAWAELADRLAPSAWGRLIVLGGTDVGKSSFLRFLARVLVRRGQTVALLDTDLGQKMVGPPACVVLAHFTPDGELRTERICFVGETSPAANMAGIIAATARLAAAAAACVDRLLVNTSGLVAGPGVALKRWKLEALSPDQIVALARADELAPIVGPLVASTVHHLQPSLAARRKSSSAREENRRAALIAALGQYRPLSLPFLRIEDLRRSTVPLAALRLCGLTDDLGNDVGLGLVRWPGHEERQQVWTGLAPTNLVRLRLGIPLADFGDVPGAFNHAY